MKHNSEDISRLDGDVYEDRHGALIDMSKVCYISGWYFVDGVGYFYKVYLSGNTVIEMFCYYSSDKDRYINPYPGFTGIINFDDVTKADEKAESIRQDFINIWKEWKKNEARK